MFSSLGSVLRVIHHDLANRLEPLALRNLLRSLECCWRDRILDPAPTIHLFILQILHGNTALRSVIETCKPLTDTVRLWHGHRTWLVDETGVSMPDTPDLHRAFGQPTNQAAGSGFPVVHILALFHAGTGLLRQILTAPLCSHEMSRVANLPPVLHAGDFLVGDRTFGTVAHLALLARKKGRGQPGLGFAFDEAVALLLGRRMLDPLAGTPFGEAARRAF